MRPYGAVDNNKDVCFHSAGSYTQSRDCHDDNLYFFSTLGEPGNQTLSVQTEITGRTTRTTTTTYRMIPFSEAGFSEFQNPPTSFSGEQVIFTSAVRSFFALWSTKFSAPPSHQHPTSTFAVQTPRGDLWCLTATTHKLFGFYFLESDVSACVDWSTRPIPILTLSTTTRPSTAIQSTSLLVTPVAMTRHGMLK